MRRYGGQQVPLAMKAIWCLLITRVVAAPLALPPVSGDSTSGSMLVVRVCAWPAYQGRISSDRVAERRVDVVSDPALVRVERSDELDRPRSLLALACPGGRSRRASCHLRC